jgi:phosphohistidine phosphatase SixA
MRHASSPQEAPTKEAADPGNTTLERQLDATGHATARAMGDAVRALRIPIGDVVTGPAFRARETAREARFTNATVAEELGDTGRSMQGVSEAQASWLRARVAVLPRSGNTLLVTHQPNLTLAFPPWGASMAQGETVVLKPDGAGGVVVVARVPIDEWPRLPRHPR